jgi:hypothetical protein
MRLQAPAFFGFFYFLPATLSPLFFRFAKKWSYGDSNPEFNHAMVA